MQFHEIFIKFIFFFWNNKNLVKLQFHEIFVLSFWVFGWRIKPFNIMKKSNIYTTIV